MEFRFQYCFHDHIHGLLNDFVSRGCDPKRAEFSICLRDVDPAVGSHFIVFRSKKFRGFFKPFKRDSVQSLFGGSTNHVPRLRFDCFVGKSKDLSRAHNLKHV